jgi:hypothetical protein
VTCAKPGSLEAVMLTNEQIAVLFDIGEFDPLSEIDRREVHDLVSEGYVVQKDDGYQLSASARSSSRRGAAV